MNNRRSVKRRWCREQGQDGRGWETRTTVNYSSVIARLGIFKSYHQAKRKCQLRVQALTEFWPSPGQVLLIVTRAEDREREWERDTQLDGNLFVLWLWSVKQNCQRATEKRNLLGNFWEVVHLPPHTHRERERETSYHLLPLWYPAGHGKSLSLCFVTQASRDVVDAANSGKKSMWKSKITSPEWHSQCLSPSLSPCCSCCCLSRRHAQRTLSQISRKICYPFVWLGLRRVNDFSLAPPRSLSTT